MSPFLPRTGTTDEPPVPCRPPERDAFFNAFVAILKTLHATSGGLHPRLFVKDADGVYLHVTDLFAADQGLTPADMVGRRDRSFYAEDLAARYRRDDLQVLASAQPISVEEPYPFDGVVRMVRTTKAPILDGDGRPIGVLGVFIDITEQMDAEQKAEQQRWMLSEGERLAHLGSWRYRNAEDHFEWSGELLQIVGLPPHQTHGTLADFLAHVHEDDRAAIEAAFHNLDHQDASWQQSARIRLVNGDLRHVIVNGRVIHRPGKAAQTIGAVQDVTELKAREFDLQRVNWMLRAITASDAALIRSASELELMTKVCEALTADDIFVLAAIAEPLDDPDKTIIIRAAAGQAVSYIDGIALSWADTPHGQGPSGTAVRTGRPSIIADIQGDPRFAAWAERAGAAGIRSSIAVPVRAGRSVIAVMGVYASEPNAFGPDEVTLLERFADNLGFGIDARRTRHALDAAQVEREMEVERFRRGMELTIEAISSTVESRDPYTAGHQRRVSDIASAIAAEMGLDAFFIQGLRLAAMVHDVGKIQIPLQILSKPGRLSSIEFDLIKTHTTAGYEILKGLDLPWPLAEAVHQHHEYLDGSGYPRGIQGDAIILEARILTVADIVESMSAPRPYRPALGLDAALAEITRQRGGRLDPQVVDACLRCFQGKTALE
ncbi:HD domain-containing phosphohydrolase [Azospirillum sp.]|uniref:HD domain-containing phosphohydrolase n=1 Tax=Azospirillum sp. TaxID=34012 RepID=UPI00260B82AD|nr:HD domain-containing phosphohydrolase [Azospirillum sp.]